MAVYMELSQGDTLVIGNSRIRLERKSGQRARLMIDSTDDIDRIKAGDDVPAAKVTPPAQTARAAPTATPFLKRPVPAAN
jgi:hypothetical protein